MYFKENKNPEVRKKRTMAMFMFCILLLLVLSALFYLHGTIVYQ